MAVHTVEQLDDMQKRMEEKRKVRAKWSDYESAWTKVNRELTRVRRETAVLTAQLDYFEALCKEDGGRPNPYRTLPTIQHMLFDIAKTGTRLVQATTTIDSETIVLVDLASRLSAEEEERDDRL